MKISAAEAYGLRCLLTLARHGPTGQLSIPDVAQMEGLSVPYVSKLLSIMRKAGLVTAVRGRNGGFCLAREPAQIDLLDVISALGGPFVDPDHCRQHTGRLDQCIHDGNCSLYQVLGGLAGYLRKFLADTTLQHVLDGERQQSSGPRQPLVSIGIGNPNKAARPESTKEEQKKA